MGGSCVIASTRFAQPLYVPYAVMPAKAGIFMQFPAAFEKNLGVPNRVITAGQRSL